MSTRNVAQIPKRTLASINPTTGERLCVYEQDSDEAVDGTRQLAAESVRKYANVPVARRAEMMTCAAYTLEKEKTNSPD